MDLCRAQPVPSWSRWVWPVVFRWQGNPCSSCGFGRLSATCRASMSKKKWTILHIVQFHFQCFVPGCVRRSRHGDETLIVICLSWHECGGMGKCWFYRTFQTPNNPTRYPARTVCWKKSQLPLLRNYLEAVCGSPCKTACVWIYIYIIYICMILYIYIYVDDLSPQHICSVMPGGAMSLAWTLRYGHRPKRKSHGAHPSATPLFLVLKHMGSLHIYVWLR